MPQTLPVTFVGAPLNPEFNGNLQQLFDAFVARLSIESQQDLSFFVSGSVAPTSDFGPWLKNGTTWYVWDVATGAYVPQVMESLSLKFIAQLNPPDQTKYVFWIQLDGTGKAISVQYYSGGAWKDVYQDKFASYWTPTDVQTYVTAAITANNVFYASIVAMNAAIATGTKTYPASGYMSGGAQSVAVDGNPHVIQYNAEAYDPDSRYSTSLWQYSVPLTGIYHVTAHVQVDNYTGTAASMEASIKITVNGNSSQLTCFGASAVASPPGSRWYPSFAGGISLTAGDLVQISIDLNDGVLAGTCNLSNGDFSIHLIQRL